MISTVACETAVLVALKTCTTAILDIKKMANCAGALVYSQGHVRRLTARLEAKQKELQRNNDFRLSLYESYDEGVISREDFISFKANYDVKVAEAEVAISVIKEEIERAAASERQNHGWTSIFKNYMDSEILTRKMVVELLTRVAVHKKGKLTVDFRYSYEFELMKGAA
jgi:hypothetical protein